MTNVEEIKDVEQFSRVLDEYLMAEIDANVHYEGGLIYSKKSQAEEEEKLMLVSEDEAYFEVNTALQVLSKNDFVRLAKTLKHPVVDLSPCIIEDYLPVLNHGDIEANKHRQCHAIPQALATFKPRLMVHLEVHAFELKLFEGSDFDFTTVPHGLTDFSKAALLKR